MNTTVIGGKKVLAGAVVSGVIMALCVVASCTNNILYKSCDDLYGLGRLSVQVISLAAHEQFDNPVPMDIYAPKEPFRYPVIIFQHGFTGSIKGYETILHHLASHGFVVVAPQMYPAGGGMGGPYPTPEEEAALGVQIIAWVQENIKHVVPVNADARVLGLSGHSRGGQIAYRMALQVPEKITALSGVDPVDGLVIFGQTLAVTGPLTFDIPTFILGAGLGPVPPPNTQFDLSCAPAEIGYQHFYDNNPSPSWLAVATEHGHTDMIDEEDLCPTEPCTTFCPGGPDRDGMRSFTAGTLAAFFSGTLQKNCRALSVLTDPEAAPVACTMEKK
jgi:chlorophyllase